MYLIDNWWSAGMMQGVTGDWGLLKYDTVYFWGESE